MKRQPAKPPPRAAGFTLLEMMTALAVFGVIGVMAAQILGGTIRLADATRERGESLTDLQRAMDIVGRDVVQMIRRPVRDELGETTAPVTITGTSLLELTRLGWQNPLGRPRSEVQRIAYMHREDTLVRLYWPVLDRAPGTQPIVQTLLDGVVEVSFAAFDDQGERHGFWPLAEQGPNEPDAIPLGLAAVEMTLRLERYGHLERLWLVPPKLPTPSAEPGEPMPADSVDGRS